MILLIDPCGHVLRGWRLGFERPGFGNKSGIAEGADPGKRDAKVFEFSRDMLAIARHNH